MIRSAYAVGMWLACGVGLGAVALQDPPQVLPPASAGPQLAVVPPPDGGLRTFIVEKTAAERSTPQSLDEELAISKRPSAILPRPHDAIHATVGVGYVQGADWGSEILATGAIGGLQVQLSSLVTDGTHGLLFNNGSLLLSDPDAHWRFDGGDIFSRLRGVSAGARLTWQAWGNRSPSIAVYGSRPGLIGRPTVLTYRDQIRIGAQTLLDAEVATDRSHALESRFVTRRFDLDLTYRHNLTPVSARDSGIQASVELMRGVRLAGGILRAQQAGESSDWRTVSVRVPLSRFFDLTIERSFVTSAQTLSRTWAAMGIVNAGPLRLFHRYQRGDGAIEPGPASTFRREQIQSMTSYVPNGRLNLALQLVTQWTDSGRPQTFEELQARVRLTRSTGLEVVTAIPDFLNERRLRGRLVQTLPGQFSIDAEYGRLSTFQDIPNALDRSRYRVMLRKTWDIATPARGGEVRGRVVDQTGRPIAGARVKLGPYATDTTKDGAYAFRYVPRGAFELALDQNLSPADFAWDGRSRRLTVSPSSREHVDLLVAPLNAIHGRVYCDRNGNGRFDAGEAVAGAVVRLGDRVTATDRDGAYNFYNLWPGTYVLQLDRARLPPEFEMKGSVDLTVTLGDDRPVTGADFRVTQKTKPIIWREVIK